MLAKISIASTSRLSPPAIRLVGPCRPYGENVLVRRYLLYFDAAAIYPSFWPPVVGVTGFDLDDCIEMVTQRYGRRVQATLVKVVREPDLTEFVPGMWPLGRSLGVTVWRGVWYPPENLAGPESLEVTRYLRDQRLTHGDHWV
jgi:hypothetical protein